MKIVNLPALPEKGDVSDWLAAGGTLEELKRLATKAPEWILLKETGDGKPAGQHVFSIDLTLDPLRKLRELPEDAQFTELEQALRDVGASLTKADELRRQMGREEAIILLRKHKVSSPARLIDSLLRQEKADLPFPPDDVDEKVERVGFKVLDDGRVIEQIASGFVVYSPDTGNISYTSRVENGDEVYVPFPSDAAIKFATQAEDYGSDNDLDQALEEYIRRYVDVSRRDEKIAAQYCKLSHITESFNELPYLRPLGESGTGKSRAMIVLTFACYRPLYAITPSPASVFRGIAKYHMTLGVDEFNPRDGDDASETIRLFNAGFMKGCYVARMEKNGDGQLVARYFDGYGAKLISSLKPLDSCAFESRCVPIETLETKRNNIKFRITQAMLDEQASLRNKLLLWRLRNVTRDREEDLDAAETFLRQPRYNIRPRHVQIGTSLVALISDEALKNEFALSLEKRTAADRVEQRESLEGQIAQAIHDLMFKIERDEASNKDVPTLNGDPEEGKPYDVVPVLLVTEALNRNLTEKRKHDEAWVGKQIRKLNLQTKKCNERSSEHRDKRVLVYDSAALAKLFAKFSLPVPPNFPVAGVASTINIGGKEVSVATAGRDSENTVADLTCREQNTYGDGDNGDGTEVQAAPTKQSYSGLEALNWPLVREGDYTLDGGAMSDTNGGDELVEDDSAFFIKIVASGNRKNMKMSQDGHSLTLSEINCNSRRSPKQLTIP